MFSQNIQRIYEKMISLFVSVPFHIGIIILGIILRVEHYLEHRSFWVDEAGTSISIVSRSFAEIIHSIEIFPTFAKPPLGFLLIEKTAVNVFGNHEFALRLFPFLCSIAALIVFYLFCRRIIDKAAVTLALLIFAVSDKLIFYSAEVKQYSTDLLFGIVLFYVFLNYRKGLSWTRAIILGVLGAIILWISNASLFVLGAIGLVVFLDACLNKDAQKVIKTILMGILWLVSFVILYKVALSKMVDNNELKASWEGAFLTAPLFSIEGIRWIMDSFLLVFRYPGGLRYSIFPFVLFLFGGVYLFKNNRLYLSIFLTTLGLTILAGILGKYPFRGRVLLFIMPVFYVLIAQGFVMITRRSKKISLLVGVIMFWFLLYKPVVWANGYFWGERSFEDNRQVLTFFKDEYQKGDFVFMNTAAQYPFWYYAAQMEFTPMFPMEFLDNEKEGVKVLHKVGQFYDQVIEERGHQFAAFKYVYNGYNEQGHFRKYYALKNLSQERFIGKNFPHDFVGLNRVWVFFSRIQVPEVKQIILDNFDRQGKRLEEYERVGASIYLYDLSLKPSS